MKYLLCSVGAATLALMATSVSEARVKPSGPPTLRSAYIIFHTKDDDKDRDSYETVTITAGQWRVGTLTNAGAGNVWKDQSDTPALHLNDIDSQLEPSDCEKIRVSINHSTQGNDNWKFSFTVVLSYTDGSSSTYQHTSKEELTKDNGHGAWDVEKAG